MHDRTDIWAMKSDFMHDYYLLISKTIVKIGEIHVACKINQEVFLLLFLSHSLAPYLFLPLTTAENKSMESVICGYC